MCLNVFIGSGISADSFCLVESCANISALIYCTCVYAVDVFTTYISAWRVVINYVNYSCVPA